MAKVSTNISLDADLKTASQELFSDLGMDFSTAITIFLKQAIRAQGLPFSVERDVPNQETIDAINEYYEMQKHPERYKTYDTIEELVNEVLGDA